MSSLSITRTSIRASATPRPFVFAALIGLVLSATVSILIAEDITNHDGLVKGDPSRLQFFIDHRPDWLVNIAKVVTDFGAFPVLLAIALVASPILWWRGVALLPAFVPVVALTLAGAAAAVGKTVFGRARPPAALHLVHETEPSFPSGHATDSTARYVALALVLVVFVLRRPIARAAVAFGLLVVTGAVGISRLVLGVHWPTDVLAWWALGTTVAFGVVLLAALGTGWRAGREPPEALRLASMENQGMSASNLPT